MSRPVDTTRGPLFSAVVRLAAPVVLMQTAETAFHVVNMFWVGRLGAPATAALGTAFFLMWALYAVANMAGAAVTATVARHVGAREPDRAAYATSQGLLLAVGLGVAVSALSTVALGPLLGWLGLAPDVLALAGTYLRIAFAVAPLTFVFIVCEAVMRAAGDTRTPLRVIACGLLLNAVLDPLLIFGLGPFPRLGVAGAAIATVIAQAASVAWFGALAARRHPAFPLDRRGLARPAPRYLGALVAIGAPFASIGFLYSAVYLFFAWVTARFGTGPVAILSVGNRIESVMYIVAAGFGLACETLVGQNLGARAPGRAARAVWIACGLISTFGAVFTVAMLAWPAAFLGFFLRDPGVVAAGIDYVRILAFGQLFTGLELVVNGGFSGAGDTRPPMWISIVVTCLRFPLAWWFAVERAGGLLALAWVITSTSAVRGLLLVGWFARGAWKTKGLATAGLALTERGAPAPAPAPAAPPS